MTDQAIADYLHTEANETVERIVMLSEKRHLPALIHATAHLLGALTIIYAELEHQGRTGEFRTYVHDQVNVIQNAALPPHHLSDERINPS